MARLFRPPHRRLRPSQGFRKFNKGDKADGQGGAAQEAQETSPQTLSGDKSGSTEYSIYQELLSSNSVSFNGSSFQAGLFNRSGSPVTIRESGSRDWFHLRCTGQRLDFISNPGLGTICLETYTGNDLKIANQTSRDRSFNRRLPQVEEKHYEEFKESAISDELIEANFFSLSGEQLFELRNPNSHEFERLNSGRLASKHLREWNKCEVSSAWGYIPVRPDTNEPHPTFYRLKPDSGTPLCHYRYQDKEGNWQNGTRKYISPAGSGVVIPFPRVDRGTWEKCASLTQQPIGDAGHFWQWLERNNAPVAIPEGEKKGLSVLSLGMPSIPICGVSMWSVKNSRGNRQLHPDLERFCKEGREILLIPDNDRKQSSQLGVRAEFFKLGLELKRRGCTVKVVEVPRQPGKAKGAIDDFVYEGGDALKLIANAVPFDIWAGKQRLTYAPNLELNQRYLDFELPDAELLCLISDKGTGKTTILNRWFGPSIAAGQCKVMLLSHRSKLNKQTSKKLGLPYINEASMAEMQQKGVALCPDSLHSGGRASIDLDDWWDATLVVDETNQFLLHLLTSPTCSDKRIEILQTLSELVKRVKRVILLDADLNDTTINLFKHLMNVEPYIVQNRYEGENKYDFVAFNDSNPSRLLNHAIQSLENGDKLMFCCGAQKDRSPYSAKNIQKLLAKKFPDKKSLVIDVETSSDPTHPAYLAISQPEVIKPYDIVLATSVIETGFDVNFYHFDKVYDIFSGLGTCDSKRQFSARYRPNVPRFVWIPTVGQTQYGSGKTTVRELLEAEYGKDRAIVETLRKAGIKDEEMGTEIDPIWMNTWGKICAPLNAERHRYRETVIEGLKAEGNRQISLEEWEKRQMLPTDSSELDDSQKAKIEQAVELKIASDIESSKDLKKEVKVNKEENYEAYVNHLSNNVEVMNDSDHEEMKRQENKTQDVQEKVKKTAISKSLGRVELTPTLIKNYERKGWRPAIKLEYLFDLGREFVKDKIVADYERYYDSNNGLKYLPDSNSRVSLGLRINLLDQMNLAEIQQLEELHNAHPLCIELFEFCRNHLEQIKIILGVELSKAKTPIECLKKILSLFCLKMPLIRQMSKAQGGHRVYGKPCADWEKNDKGKPRIVNGRAIPLDDGRSEVWGAWVLEDAEKRAEKEKQAEVEVAAAAYAERVKAEMQTANISGGNEAIASAAEKLANFCGQEEPDKAPETDTPEYYLEWEFLMQNGFYLKQGIARIGLNNLIEAGVRWAGECADKLEWLMGHPQMSSAF